MILIAFTQLLGLDEETMLEVAKKQDTSDIKHYVGLIRTIQKEKSLVLFITICQQLIELSDNPHFISIAYKRILMDIGYSSKESDDILEGTYFDNRDIEAYKPNHDSSISDLDLMADYFSKQCEQAEEEIKELTTSISEQENNYEEDDSEYVTPKFLHNWKFIDFLNGRDYNIQIKETVNCETGEHMHSLVLQDASDRQIYLSRVSYLEGLTILEILGKKEDLLVGITEYGNFWLHDGSKLFYMEADQIY